jgi:hypothetical protein
MLGTLLYVILIIIAIIIIIVLLKFLFQLFFIVPVFFDYSGEMLYAKGTLFPIIYDLH